MYVSVLAGGRGGCGSLIINCVVEREVTIRFRDIMAGRGAENLQFLVEIGVEMIFSTQKRVEDLVSVEFNVLCMTRLFRTGRAKS